ncbi:MAG TPA: hypothetical protein VD994_19900 [Prosthecobacter sp.]|nr:hypothetical protein [Prosthecobacter sp.]
MNNSIRKELRRAARLCFAQRRWDWWAHELRLTNDAYWAAHCACRPFECHKKPEDAATYLLLCAEAV